MTTPPAMQLILRVLVMAAATADVCWTAPPYELRVGVAGHAFDHLGNLGEQAEAAAASGSTIIYATGLGTDGYQGLPDPAAWRARMAAAHEYVTRAKSMGIQRVLGYVCATSIVGLNTFDRHWPTSLRGRIRTPPTAWLQQDAEERPLPSWYGGDYRPACMNHPDWRAYERFMVRQQLEAGHDGIFFDNPTVHPKGCYCEYCLRGFGRYLRQSGMPVADDSVATLRQRARESADIFLRYRSTIARDFLGEMRAYARTIRPGAWVTCNNSLNAPQALYSQARLHGYQIHELSRVEDFVVVEDMATQPRVTASGQVYEYGPTYRQLAAIARRKPVVAVTLADGDYHTPPNLMRLAMAEAAAHEASYLSWPTWPETERRRMVAAVRPQADFLRAHQTWLNETQARCDALLFLPVRRWVETDECKASSIAACLTRSNIQYEVVTEDNLAARLRRPVAGRPSVLVAESRAVFTPREWGWVERFQRRGGRFLPADAPDWQARLPSALLHPTLEVHGPPTVRGVVRDAKHRTVVHLYNLNVERLGSFSDRVTAAEGVRVRCWVPLRRVSRVEASSADPPASQGALRFELDRKDRGTWVTWELPRLEISTLVAVQ